MSGTVVAASGVLIDSDVLIWFARGNARALSLRATTRNPVVQQWIPDQVRDDSC
ncbi:MAG: hypothetical protein WCI85_15835 [Comamonadaceae bacterium]